jgi:hypothetical protein
LLADCGRVGGSVHLFKVRVGGGMWLLKAKWKKWDRGGSAVHSEHTGLRVQ